MSIRDKLFQIIYKVAYKLALCIWYIFRPQCYGVYIAVWCENKLLIIKNSYKKEYTIPCGMIDRGEEKIAAAVRELHEEVNIVVAPEQLQLIGEFTCNHEFKQDTGTFYETEFSRKPTVKVDNREVIWAEFLLPTEITKLHLSPLVRAYLNSKNSHG